MIQAIARSNPFRLCLLWQPEFQLNSQCLNSNLKMEKNISILKKNILDGNRIRVRMNLTTYHGGIPRTEEQYPDQTTMKIKFFLKRNRIGFLTNDDSFCFSNIEIVHQKGDERTYLHIKEKASLAERAEAQGCSDEHGCNYWRLGIVQKEQ